MTHHSAPRIGRLTAAVTLALALVSGFGCSVERTDDPPAAPDSSTLTTPTEIGAAQQCKSKISGTGLVCSQCPGDEPGAGPECLAAACQVENRSLVCTDPKGRVGVDKSVDYSKFVLGNYSAGPNGVFSFAQCTFLYGVPKSSGTTCFYPGANTCETTVSGDFHCMECRYPDGGSLSICGAKDDPLYDPLIERPDDLPAPGFCVNDLSADGQVECTTCMHDDLSATRSCHYPGIVACGISGLGETDDAGCVGRCTFEDGHEERMCDSPRGLHPVPLP